MEHAKIAHGMAALTPDMIAEVQDAIKDLMQFARPVGFFSLSFSKLLSVRIVGDIRLFSTI